jgi:hypothetical protein
MLPRLISRRQVSYRAYSFSSSKPGGGRSFNSTTKSIPRPGSNANTGNVETPSTASEASEPVTSHPKVSAQDYKLHQFFSLYRPLLLLSQSTLNLFESPPHDPFALPKPGEVVAPPRPAHLGTLDDPPEATPEADAEAARQLARALVINRVGATMAWEETLRRLGLNIEEDVTGFLEVVSKKSEVSLDSTKRKRRKKMKKHK